MGFLGDHDRALAVGRRLDDVEKYIRKLRDAGLPDTADLLGREVVRNSKQDSRLDNVEERIENLEASTVGAPDRLALHADLIAAMRRNLTDINLWLAKARNTQGIHAGELTPAQRHALEQASIPGEIHPLDPLPTVDPIHARAVADIVKRRGCLDPRYVSVRNAIDWLADGARSPREVVVSAAAILLAEIERLDREALVAGMGDAVARANPK